MVPARARIESHLRHTATDTRHSWPCLHMLAVTHGQRVLTDIELPVPAVRRLPRRFKRIAQKHKALRAFDAHQCSPYRVLRHKLLAGNQARALNRGVTANHLGRKRQEQLIQQVLAKKSPISCGPPSPTQLGWPKQSQLRDQPPRGIQLLPDVPQQHALYIAIPESEASFAPLS